MHHMDDEPSICNELIYLGQRWNGRLNQPRDGWSSKRCILSSMLKWWFDNLSAKTLDQGSDFVSITHWLLRNQTRVHYSSRFQLEPTDGVHRLMGQDLILDHDWLRTFIVLFRRHVDGSKQRQLRSDRKKSRVAESRTRKLWNENNNDRRN